MKADPSIEYAQEFDPPQFTDGFHELEVEPSTGEAKASTGAAVSIVTERLEEVADFMPSTSCTAVIP